MKTLNKCVDAENEAVHGFCLCNTRARLVFPVTTVVPKTLRISGTSQLSCRMNCSLRALTRALEQLIRAEVTCGDSAQLRPLAA